MTTIRVRKIAIQVTPFVVRWMKNELKRRGLAENDVLIILEKLDNMLAMTALYPRDKELGVAFIEEPYFEEDIRNTLNYLLPFDFLGDEPIIPDGVAVIVYNNRVIDKLKHYDEIERVARRIAEVGHRG